MRVHPDIARAYAAQHGAEFEAAGVARIEGDRGIAWERFEAEELATLALDAGDQSVDGWFTRRLVDTRAPAQIAITAPVDARTTVQADAVTVAATIPPRVVARTVTFERKDGALLAAHIVDEDGGARDIVFTRAEDGAVTSATVETSTP